MKWFSKFDKIFLINLPERTDRLQQSTEELDKRGIPFEVWTATKDDNGAYGLWLTMKSLFEYCHNFSYRKILVVEDDIKFTSAFSDLRMEECLNELDKRAWDLFYLGANANAPLTPVEGCVYLLQCASMLSTHAVMYSRSGQQLILEEMRKDVRRIEEQIEPLDQMYERVVQSRGNCYISSEILATQRVSKSDILGFEVDNKKHIEDNFCTRIKNMGKL